MLTTIILKGLELASIMCCKKRRIIMLIFFLLLTGSITKGQVGIGTNNPASSSALDVTSTTKGILPPRLTLLNRNDIDNPAPGLMIWCSDCGTYGEVQVFNGSIWTDISGNTTPVIGDVYGGGKIAYILQPGDPGYVAGEVHGIVIYAVTSSYFTWGCYGVLIPGADGTTLGTGVQNTIDIVNACNDPSFASKLCNDLVYEGYSDWHLPSKDELYKLYLSGDLISSLWSDTYHWTSSEVDINHAWSFNSSWGGFFEVMLKSTGAYVRPVRSF